MSATCPDSQAVVFDVSDDDDEEDDGAPDIILSDDPTSYRSV